MLLNSQRNQLFQILAEKGLIASDFKESKHNDSYRIDLVDKPNSIYFHVLRSKKDNVDKYQITKRPGSQESPDNRSIIFRDVWDSANVFSCIYDFSSWISDVKVEIDSPDLWEENIKALQLFSSDFELVAERFSISELGAVQGQL